MHIKEFIEDMCACGMEKDKWRIRTSLWVKENKPISIYIFNIALRLTILVSTNKNKNPMPEDRSKPSFFREKSYIQFVKHPPL